MKSLFTCKQNRAEGFTIVELLVVLATLAVLAVMLLPAIAGTKPNAQAFQCLENHRQLMLAVQMYAQDNSDLLPPNDYPYLTAYATMGTSQANHKNWVVGTMAQALDAGDKPYQLGQVSELLDPNTLLSPYLTNRPVYHCPADNYIDPYAGHTVHCRSYSMNSAVGTIYGSSVDKGGTSSKHVGEPVGGGWLPGASYNDSQGTWRTYGKMTSFTKPGPANTWMIMDANPRTINDGSLAIPANAQNGGTPGTYVIDFPTSTHNGSVPISFADGHVIVHKFQDPRTYTVIINGQGNVIQANTKFNPDNPDCFYLSPITSALR